MLEAKFQKVGDYHRVKIVPNEEGTRLKLDTTDEHIQAKAEKLTDETTSKHMIENRLQASRIQNLKMFTVPVWIFSSFAIRNVVSSDFAPAIPGALWITDLLMPDPYLVLPALVGLFGFANLFVSSILVKVYHR